MGEVDEEDDGGRQQSQAGDEEAQPPPVAAGGQGPEGDSDQPQRNQEVGVGLSGGTDFECRRPGHTRQARVAGLTDLDSPVVDELGGDEADTRGDDHETDRSLGGEDRAGPGCRARRRGTGLAQPAIAQGQAAEEPGCDRS
jgi:hypothetical protein